MTACREAPAVAKLVVAALSPVPEQRPTLSEFAAGVDAAVLHVAAAS